jgi:hypothetical protein
MPFIDKLIPQPQWAKDLQAQVATMQGQTLLTTWVNYNNAVYPDWGIFKELEAMHILVGSTVFTSTTLLSRQQQCKLVVRLFVLIVLLIFSFT